TATHEHDGVLLEVVPDPRDVRRHFHVIGETDTGDLPKSRVRLLRSHGSDDRADTTLLGRATAELHEATLLAVPGRAERGCVHFLALRLASLAYELRDGWHRYSFYWWSRALTGAPLTGVRVVALLVRPRSPPRLGYVLERIAAAVTRSRQGRSKKLPP